MIPDKLLINLKILSRIPKNGRISRSLDGIISLETDTIYQPFRRFFTSDSRKQSVSEINSIINECIETLLHINNSKWMNIKFKDTEEYHKGMENISLLINSLKLAEIGIENLKFTYQTDPNISCQLEIIILKINTTLKEFSQKLSNYTADLEKKLEESVNQFGNSNTEINTQNIPFDNFQEINLNTTYYNQHNSNYNRDPADLV